MNGLNIADLLLMAGHHSQRKTSVGKRWKFQSYLLLNYLYNASPISQAVNAIVKLSYILVR